MIKKIDSSNFTWDKWRNGSIHEIIGSCREYNIINNKKKLLKYIEGYCNGENLMCRPKNAIAIMFFKDGRYFWNHVTKTEFKILKGEIS